MTETPHFYSDQQRATALESMFLQPLRLSHPKLGQFEVEPPNAADGATLTALYTVLLQRQTIEPEPETCSTCGQAVLTATNRRLRAALEAAKDRDVEDIALGEDNVRRLKETGVPGQDIALLGIYAMVFWVGGQTMADTWLRAAQDPAGSLKATKPATSEDSGSGEAPKVSKNGPNMGSGSRMSKASTRGTRSPATSNQKARGSRKKNASGKKTS
ncbi:Uncharacterised protein [Actinobaculum suis]|uniref:DUF7426 domain-containing protein n=1 Tax=Actinobaculum suis TaxID=1657 RepID=A0A7Z8Y909_9ACTO|nr:hypothetical protein [Actinobaculum suis]VDG76162.1 Uncharacterised protein [Actinobaculum suis]